jgi:hypothetical protein
MPDYYGLALQGVFDLGAGIRVFAGQRKETFYIDLGSTFDTLNFRRNPPVLTDAEDANDAVNPFGLNDFQELNISTIAIEVPLSSFPSVLGMYASTSRSKLEVRKKNGTSATAGPFVQVARMANPLVNELIIDTPSKDLWNSQEPEDEAQFQEFYKNPSIAQALALIFNVPVTPTPRTDLMSLLLKYPGQALAGSNCGSPCSELLRLNLQVMPTQPENQKRLGGLAGDAAGFPNGRRPNDDVTDIAIRVVGGENYIAAGAGDGVNFLQGTQGSNLTANGIYKVFPYLPTPYDGRNRRHLDCGEQGTNPCN